MKHIPQRLHSTQMKNVHTTEELHKKPYYTAKKVLTLNEWKKPPELK